MKIAVVSDNGKNISKHFGRALYYVVYEVDNGEITNLEQREKRMGHHSRNHNHEHNHSAHYHGEGQDDLHRTMASEVADCQVLIVGGMGYGAYKAFFEQGLNVILTTENDAETAVKMFLNGQLKNYAADLLH